MGTEEDSGPAIEDRVKKQIWDIFETPWDRKTPEGVEEYQQAIGKLWELRRQFPELYDKVTRDRVSLRRGEPRPWWKFW